MARSLIDANVLLEILFARKLSDKCEQLLSNPSKEYTISALTLHIIWYMAERHKLSSANIIDMLSVLTTLPLTELTISLANTRYDKKDFEDCLQAACAETNDCEEIITIDKHFKEYSHTKLPVIVV
ncbi:MAG TPA: type II toxin-antitoxin system VapC family toxin [Candidatus Saccharimonadales bacterium]|nr:type II toxin-antitoxin system VapC family toxin [Candidatus Saccharimonadales bacterium]